MIIEKNNKEIKIIGYFQSQFTKDYFNFLIRESKNKISIISPECFLNLKDKNKYQYVVGFSLDMEMRNIICDYIDSNNLDCVSYFDNSSIIFNNSKLGKGIFIGPFSTIQNCIIGDYTHIECYCLIAHEVNLGRNCIIHPGTLIAGKCKIGNNCTFGIKSSIINKVNIVNNVNLGAFSNAAKDINKPGKYVGTIARYVGENKKYV